MTEISVAGQVIGGSHGQILIRQKTGEKIELGDLLVVPEDASLQILQVYGLAYGSQVSQAMRELLSGLKLEGYGTDLTFLEPQLRNYVMAMVKVIAKVEGKSVSKPKTMPAFFSTIRRITRQDLAFLAVPPNPVHVGRVRSGSKTLDVDVYMNGVEVFTHHVAIPATTGRGKSNLVKVMLWSILDSKDFGVLVLDPHDEYYGRKGKGLKDHPKASRNLLYYSATPPTGTSTLILNLRSIFPSHFQGIVEFTDAQQDAIKLYYNRYKQDWIENIVKGIEVKGVAPRTLEVLQRKFDNTLGVYIDDDGELQCRTRIFSDSAGTATIGEIVNALENGKKVVLDTSRLLDEAELIIGSAVARSIFNRYQKYKSNGTLAEKPVVSIVVEEAPRVLSSDVLTTRGDNIYSTIAREGRKFKVGLLAITQLISLIPRRILANINTKIILGNEMSVERKAVIDSAAQDLSDDDRTIASLDKGEAIVSSSFTRFAVPIQIPLFEDYIKDWKGAERENQVFVG